MINLDSAAISAPRELVSPAVCACSSVLTKQQVLARNNVHIFGQGKPPILLCSGFGYNQRVWQPLATALAQDYQVIVFDHVGTGGSDLAAYETDKYAHLGGYA